MQRGYGMNYMNRKSRDKETGIYVVCSDKALLERINTMLSCRGIIGIADGEGHFHYFVDGRKRPGKAVSDINEIVVRHAAKIESEVPECFITSVINEALVFYDFDMTLMGTNAIFEIIRRMVIYREVYYHGMRQLYGIACDVLKLTYEQAERDIRYAIRRSGFETSGLKTTKILHILADDVTDRLAELKRQPV